MENQFVIFKLGNEFYGVNIIAVESIIKMQEITKMPHVPDFVEGITNLRGMVIPVIDLRKRFRMSQIAETKDTRIIVVEMNGVMAGMVVDAVTEVVRVAEDDIEPPSPMVNTVDTAFITGIAKVDKRLIILLDLSRVLTVAEKEHLHAVIA